MLKYHSFNSKNHCHILLNGEPKPWEQRYTLISRDKARELEKLRKVGKLPENFFVFEVEEGSFGHLWNVRQMLCDQNRIQKDMKDFFFNYDKGFKEWYKEHEKEILDAISKKSA